ncbi:DNA ligase D [Sphingorhabdus sp.]|uniref:DNA ligase D n=1 Tax=Sphingorhabdus sp. TaxID=1902408 RepID=UPI00391949EF
MASKNPLSSYNEKRNFEVTAEPEGKIGTSDGSIFIVQKHDATRLHYDFRLELEGVLKSWAVTKGPSLNPDDKRLAVRTEDHPISYAEFEGTIAEGEYGGGTVMLWDSGHWESVEGKDPKVTIEEGHLHFHLYGQRLKGEWLLVRMKPRGKEKRENWLLRKIQDDAASETTIIIDTELTSIATGRTMSEIASGKSFVSRKATKNAQSKGPDKRARGKLPAFSEPQLATLVDSVPEGRSWIHEVKYDGYRCLISACGQEVRAYTRSGLDWSERFGEIVAAIRKFDLPPCLIDGEIVALDGEGRPSFSHLQSVLKGESGKLAFFAFDLLELDGKSIRALPNIQRKEQLQNVLKAAKRDKTIFVAEHVLQGEKLFTTLCGNGYEGIISKKADAAYLGKRTRNWLKVKCTLRQEFIVIGFTKSEKARGFKSLLLGSWVDGELHYVGKVGTGFTASLMNDLLVKMDPLTRADPPALVPKAAARAAHWVEPELIAEIAYAEITGPLQDGGVLRHASFLGLREDKSAREVKPEKAVPISEPDLSTVNITNRERVIFPESGVTKGALADYYALLSEAILRNMAHRPLSVVRCPQGRAKQCFFQKHDAGTFGPDVHHVSVKDKDGESDDYLYVDNADGILGCVQMGAIEFHGWGARVPKFENPDKLIFDLDPDVGLDFEAVKKAALLIKTELSHMGLVSSAMLSGGKGIHVVVTLDGKSDWPTVKDFSSRFARALSQAKPDIFTASIRKAERKGRIFIDWLRNQRGATAVQPWTVRAREGAPVAMPIDWDELTEVKSASAYSLKDVDTIVKRAGSSSLSNWAAKKQKLPSL